MSLLLCCLILSPYAFANDADPALQSLMNFKESRVTVKYAPAEEERLKVLKIKANSIGLQSGAFYAANKIRTRLEGLSNTLDNIFDFGRLGVVRNYKGAYIVNPIVSEVEKSIMLSPDSRSFVIRDQIFLIAKDPYLSLSIPSWRSYIEFQVEPVRIPDDMIPPNTEEEIQVWKRELLIGYQMGINQVEDIFVTRFARLSRDIIGMQRYELLRQRNMVSDIKIADAYYPVSGGGNRMNINESRVSIEINPALNSNRWDWETIPRLADVSDLFPNGSELRNWVTLDVK